MDEEDQLDHKLGGSTNQAVQTSPTPAYLSVDNQREAALTPTRSAHDGTYHHGSIHGFGRRIRTNPFCGDDQPLTKSGNQQDTGAGLCGMKSASSNGHGEENIE